MDKRALPSPLILPHGGDLPVLLSIAHSGRDYPAWLVDQAAADLNGLQSLEDPLVDRMAWRAVARGVGAVIAQSPRAAIDCNRSPSDVDPAAVHGAPAALKGSRAFHGLGLVPTRSQRSGQLWRAPLDPAELARRLDAAYHPFHRAIEVGLDRLATRHYQVILLDCHSMPPRRGQAELVIGDVHGRTSAPWLTQAAARIARGLGWSVAVNDPYAGGEIVRRHGQPSDRRHALQLEFDRRSYLSDDLRTPGPGFDRAARLLEQIVLRLGAALIDTGALAAE